MKIFSRLSSLRAQIVLLCLGFSTLLAVAAAVLTFTASQHYLRESQRQSSIINLQILGGELDAELQRVQVLSDFIQIDPTIRNYLKTISDPSSGILSKRTQALSSWERLNNQFNTSGVRSSLNRVVVAVVGGKSFIQVMSTNGQPSNFNSEKIMNSGFFQPLYKARGIMYSGIQINPLDFSASQQIIPIIRPVRSSNSSQILGWMYLEMNTDMIIRRMQSFSLAQDAALYISIGDSYSYMYQDGSLVPSEPPTSALSLSMLEESWTLYLVPSENELHPRQQYIYLIASLIFAAVFLAGILLSIILRQKITCPVEKLLDRIEITGRGDFSLDPSIEWDNELGRIGKGINELSSSIQRLMDNRIRDEKTRRELEYRILQSQINPHFMYNTLNTIRWMASIQGADGIAELSTALSRLLKNIAKVQKDIIPLREELRLVDDYFTIMKYRYGGSIELESIIDDDTLLDAGIHRFSLQPILENAIFHGIEPKGSAGKISIHILRDSNNPECYYIKVRDNGIGMSEAQIERVLTGEEESHYDFFRHIGISNVNQRIRYSFGDSYGLSIKSIPMEYTELSFYLPVDKVHNIREA